MTNAWVLVLCAAIAYILLSLIHISLAPVLPSQTGEVLLIDGGANADCKPQYLQQFGVMGSIYMQKVFGLKSPKVALINNGAEEEKGSELTKKAYQLLKEAPINFVGNAEGRELLSGEFDVLVCDGFTGNIVLKFLEGCAKTILGMLKGYIKESASAKLGSVFMKSAFGKLKKKMDYKEYGDVYKRQGKGLLCNAKQCVK